MKLLRSLGTYLIASALACCDGWSQDLATQTPFAGDSLRDRVQLLPAGNETQRDSNTQYLEKQIGAKLSDEAARLFTQGEEGKWKNFSDDLVRFEIPDAPQLKVDVLNLGTPEQISIVGGSVGTSDRSFERAYRVTFDRRIPYLTIFVREAEWLDEGFCFCGAIAFTKWIVADGNLLEFGLLESGEIKKVQALAAKHRAILVEWTHSAIPQQAYARIGRSLRLIKSSPASTEEWRARMDARKRPNESVGWIEPGDDSVRVRQLLGEPTRIDHENWIYVRENREHDGSGYRNTLRVPMREGKFLRFEQNWSESEAMEPVRGSLSWALNFRETDKRVRISKADLNLAVTSFLEKAEANNGEDWSMWCQAIHELYERGLRDDRVIQFVSNRFLDPARAQHHGAWILERGFAKNRALLFEKRAWLLLKSDPPEVAATASASDELFNLISFLGSRRAVTKEIVRTAIHHRDTNIRYIGVLNATLLSTDEGLSAATTAIEDPDYSLHRAAASTLRRLAKPDHLPWLRDRVAKEIDPSTKEDLAALVSRLEGKRNKPRR